MIQTCLNHRHLTYDFCFHCPKKGKDLDCPEYLADAHYKTRQTGERDKPLLPVPLQSRAELGLSAESYSRVVLLQNVRSISEPFLPRPNFLERFRRSQR